MEHPFFIDPSETKPDLESVRRSIQTDERHRQTDTDRHKERERERERAEENQMGPFTAASDEKRGLTDERESNIDSLITESKLI